MATDNSFYNFHFKTPSGETISLSEYKGKVVLIVNTATQCRYTPQFKGLEKLHQQYKDQGLVVLGFPCNQFLAQEPISNEKMKETCEINHGVTFQLTEKVKVNGQNTHPIFKHLKSKKWAIRGPKINWNFTKFLIDRNGKVVKRFSFYTKPFRLGQDIKRLIND